ncbi:MAG: esterase-like activity of phytase family protein [Candidatus Binatia bacterium]
MLTNLMRRPSEAIALFSFALAAVPAVVQHEEAREKARVTATYTLPDVPLGGADNPSRPEDASADRGIRLGSIGSDLWRGAGDPDGEFWMITDRGPNGLLKIDGETRRTFLAPEFNPAILRVKLDGGAIRILETVPLVTGSGKPVTGLPNVAGRDETPYDHSGREKLSFNPNGLDSEGLVQTATGEFWVAEEYGPSLLKIDRTGKVMKRYIPEGVKLEGADYAVMPVLPAIYGKRKINRGFEGLALSDDQKILYIALQSPLSNPDKKTGDASRNTRILAFDIPSEKVVAEYFYRFDAAKDFDPAHSKPDEMKISGLLSIKPDTLLVLERTDWVAKLYLVDLAAATNILGGKWDDPATAPALEALEEPVEDAKPLAKTLLANLKEVDGVPEKIEGIAVIDANTIAVSNDNDFDIGEPDRTGNNVGKGMKSHTLILRLGRPLPLPPPANGQPMSAH